MESHNAPTLLAIKSCSCDCDCPTCGGGGGSSLPSSSMIMNRSFSGTYLRSVKRKYDEVDDNKFLIPGLALPHPTARVEIENEAAALREMVSSQQATIQDLLLELEEERNAASSAANEAMSMILRLQREKAEVQMEARQFKRFAEEKMAHDQQEMLALEDLLYKREQAIQSLTCEVQAYKHRMLSYGLSEGEIEGSERGPGMMSRNNSMLENSDGQFEFPAYDYPPLRCNLNEGQVSSEFDNEAIDVEKYAFGETPRSRDHLKDLEYRINQLERTPRSNATNYNDNNQGNGDADFYGSKNVLEKVVVGQSPRRPRHLRKFSTESSNSPFANGREFGPDLVTDSPKWGASFRKAEYSLTEEKVDNGSDVGDDTSDRVYTIDSIHQGAPYNGVSDPTKPSVGMGDDYVSTPRDDVADPEIKKLYVRLQALEADRESMRQALISMRTDKAQLVLLKEIAQQLCKEMTPARRAPIRKPSLVGSFSFMSIFKWIVSFVFWRKKARRSKYMFGLSANNVGLLMLLDKGPHAGQWRCLSSTQV